MASSAPRTGLGSEWRLRKLRRAPTWAVVGGLVLLSTAGRAWASRDVPTPWIAPDEMIYGLLARSLYHTGKLAILGGPTPFYSAVVPALDGAALSIRDLELGYSVQKVLQALVMSLTAVPAYLWGASLMARRWALLAAALSVALPGLAYSGLIMTEVAFYPVLLLAAWAAAAAIASPTRTRQALLVLALALAVGTRLQATLLVPAVLSALLVDSLFARRRPRLAAFGLTLAGIALGACLWVAWRLVAGESLLAGYSGAGGRYGAARAARFVAYHAGDAALLTGVLPLCALLVLAWRAVRRGEQDSRVRAYLAVAVSIVFWFVLGVGVFASREVGLLAERNLIAVAPLLFLGFALWLDRGAPGGYWQRALAGIVVAASVLAVPLRTFVTPEALPDSFSLVPLYHLRRLTSLQTTELVFAVAVSAAVALFVFVPPRRRFLLPAVLLAVLIAGSAASSREVSSQAKAQKLHLFGPSRRWIDARAGGAVAYVYDGQAYWNAVWENLFWNRRIRWVYDLPGTEVPGPLPQQHLKVDPSGELRPGGAVSPARFAVAPLNYELVGARIASEPQFGTDRRGLGLWRLVPPLRLSTITSGLEWNGDVLPYGAALTVYHCRSGTFDLVLLVKEPQLVRVLVNGRVVRKKFFPMATTWYLRLEVPRTAAGTRRICKLVLLSSGLLGTTRFEFER